MKHALTMLIAATAILATASVYAQDKERKGPPPGGPRGEMPLLPPRLEKDLALTTDQKAKVDEISAKFAAESKAWKAANKPAKNYRAEMGAAREAGDEAKQEQLRAEMREHGKPLMELRKQHMDQVRALLTPEQVAKLDEAREKMQERAGERGAKPAGKPEGKKKE